MQPPMHSIDEYYIARCLELAESGRGRVSPNPLVGAVVLDAKGRKVGEGFHAKAGDLHAEVAALNDAGEEARGGTLYVNLEPCNHHGKTPPCTDRIIESGIETVICGTLDPNPLVSGSGRDRLQNSRISVRHGFLEKECNRLNEIFFYNIAANRPFVALKLAMTMDGKIATRNGTSQWITGELARQYVHHLRCEYEAILTTADTVMADNPQLTIRNIWGKKQKTSPIPHPMRIVLDRHFKLDPNEYRIFDTQTSPTIVLTSNVSHNTNHVRRAKEKGVEVIEVDDTGLGLNLKNVLDVLGEKRISSIFVESGGRLAGSMLNQGLVNKLYLFYGATVLPDPSARDALSDAVNLSLPDAPKLKIDSTQRLENDLVVTAYPELTAKPAKKNGKGTKTLKPERVTI